MTPTTNIFFRPLYSTLKVTTKVAIKVTVTVTALLFCLLTSLASAEDRVFRKVLTYPPTSFDPVYGITNSDSALRVDIFEALLSTSADGKIRLGAAKSMDILNQGQSYRFVLRPSLRWSDGQKLTARDYLTTVERILKPTDNNKLPKYSRAVSWLNNAEAIKRGQLPLGDIGVELISDQEIIFHLSKPIAFFDQLIANALYPSPTHLIERFGEQWAHIDNHVSNGPYRLDRIAEDGTIILEDNPYHRDRAKLYFKNIHLMIGDSQQIRQLFAWGAIDTSYDYPRLMNGNNFVERMDYTLHHQLMGPLFFIKFNTADPVLAKLTIRHALQLVTDYELIINRLKKTFPSIRSVHGLLQPHRSQLPPTQQPEWMTWPREKRVYRAQQLLQQAGYSKTNRLKLRLHSTNQPAHRLTTNALANQWAQIYIDLEVIEQSGKRHYTDIASGNFQMGIVSRQEKFNDPLAWLLVLRPHGPNNFANWNSTGYGELLDQIAQMTDSPERQALVHRAHQQILQAAPLLPLFNVNNEPSILRKDLVAPKQDEYLQARYISRKIP